MADGCFVCARSDPVGLEPYFQIYKLCHSLLRFLAIEAKPFIAQPSRCFRTSGIGNGKIRSGAAISSRSRRPCGFLGIVLQILI
jgi:hypothetical protein